MILLRCLKKIRISTHINPFRRFIYMGQLDDNDAVQYDDAYTDNERNIINETKGKNVPDRFLYCQKNYLQNNFNVRFKTYETVGHWTTSAMNIEVIKFF